jgi:hypothetical protein
MYDFGYHRISVEGLEGEIRQVAADIKKLDYQLSEDKNDIRSYFKGKFTFQIIISKTFMWRIAKIHH